METAVLNGRDWKFGASALTAISHWGFVSGHDFSRADKALKMNLGL
jgi:hypothetical protein